MKKKQLLLLLLSSSINLFFAQNTFENKQYGFSMKKPSDWIVANNEELMKNLEKIDLTDESLTNFINSNKGSVLLTSFYKYDLTHSGLIPTIQVKVRLKTGENFLEFKNAIIQSTEGLKKYFEDFKYIDETKEIEISGIKSVYSVVMFSMKANGGELIKVRSRAYSIPSGNYFLQINFTDGQVDEDCSSIFDELVKTIKIGKAKGPKEQVDIKQIENITLTKDTVLINEPFRITYLMDGTYLPPGQTLEMLFTKKQIKEKSASIITAFQLKSSNKVFKIELPNEGQFADITYNGTNMSYIFASKKSGKVNLPEFTYFKNGKTFTIKNKSIFVLKKKISPSDSLLILKNISRKPFKMPENEEHLNFDSSKIEVKAFKNVIHTKNNEAFEIKYETNCISDKIVWNKPNLKDFEIISGPNQQTSTTIINGKRKDYKSINCTIKSQRQGAFVIMPISILCDGIKIESDEITVVVE